MTTKTDKEHIDVIKELDGCLSDIDWGGKDAVELVREIRDGYLDWELTENDENE